MKTLFLIRHAKSSWEDPDLADFDRPLNARGRKAATFMGRLVADRGYRAELIVSSPAVRAMMTAERFNKTGGLHAELTIDDRIYEASASTLLYVVSVTRHDIASLMLVGHNPGIEGLIRVLTGKNQQMPTAAVAIIDLDIRVWKRIAAGAGKLRSITRPRDEMS